MLLGITLSGLDTSTINPASFLKRMKKRTDYEEIGGAPLLGVDGVVIIGHGRSNARAVRSALRVAANAVDKGVVDAIEKGLAALPQTGITDKAKGASV